MSKTIHEFNDIIRKLRKGFILEKDRKEYIRFLLKIWLSQLQGNLTPTETFICKHCWRV